MALTEGIGRGERLAAGIAVGVGVGTRVRTAVALGLGVAVDPEVGGVAGDGRRHWQNKKIAATREVIAAHCRKADRETRAIDLLGGIRRISYSEFCRGMDHCHEKILRHHLIDKSETGSEDELFFMSSDPNRENPQPEYLFKPGQCIVNSNFAEEFREGTCTLEQFDEMKLVVLEIGVDAKTGRPSYSLLHNSPGEGAESFSWGKNDKWFLKEYVEQNFEVCDYPVI